MEELLWDIVRSVERNVVRVVFDGDYCNTWRLRRTWWSRKKIWADNQRRKRRVLMREFKEFWKNLKKLLTQLKGTDEMEIELNIVKRKLERQTNHYGTCLKSVLSQVTEFYSKQGCDRGVTRGRCCCGCGGAICCSRCGYRLWDPTTIPLPTTPFDFLTSFDGSEVSADIASKVASLLEKQHVYEKEIIKTRMSKEIKRRDDRINVLTTQIKEARFEGFGAFAFPVQSQTRSDSISSNSENLQTTHVVHQSCLVRKPIIEMSQKEKSKDVGSLNEELSSKKKESPDFQLLPSSSQKHKKKPFTKNTVNIDRLHSTKQNQDRRRQERIQQERTLYDNILQQVLRDQISIASEENNKKKGKRNDKYTQTTNPTNNNTKHYNGIITTTTPESVELDTPKQITIKKGTYSTCDNRIQSKPIVITKRKKVIDNSKVVVDNPIPKKYYKKQNQSKSKRKVLQYQPVIPVVYDGDMDVVISKEACPLITQGWSFHVNEREEANQYKSEQINNNNSSKTTPSRSIKDVILSNISKQIRECDILKPTSFALRLQNSNQTTTTNDLTKNYTDESTIAEHNTQNSMVAESSHHSGPNFFPNRDKRNTNDYQSLELTSSIIIDPVKRDVNQITSVGRKQNKRIPSNSTTELSNSAKMSMWKVQLQRQMEKTQIDDEITSHQRQRVSDVLADENITPPCQYDGDGELEISIENGLMISSSEEPSGQQALDSNIRNQIISDSVIHKVYKRAFALIKERCEADILTPHLSDSEASILKTLIRKKRSFQKKESNPRCEDVEEFDRNRSVKPSDVILDDLNNISLGDSFALSGAAPRGLRSFYSRESVRKGTSNATTVAAALVCCATAAYEPSTFVRVKYYTISI